MTWLQPIAGPATLELFRGPRRGYAAAGSSPSLGEVSRVLRAVRRLAGVLPSPSPGFSPPTPVSGRAPGSLGVSDGVSPLSPSAPAFALAAAGLRRRVRLGFPSWSGFSSCLG